MRYRFQPFLVLSLLFLFQSCYFPSYQAVATTSLYDVSFTSGKWYLGPITIDGKPFSDFSDYSEKEMRSCLQDSLYLSYGKQKALYNVPILTAKNTKESLTLLRATKTIDYVIQITGTVGENHISGIMLKPMKDAQKSTASITFNVFEVANEKLIYSQTTSGQIIVENNSEDVLFGKSAQTLLKNCLKKGMKQFKKSGGCE